MSCGSPGTCWRGPTLWGSSQWCDSDHCSECPCGPPLPPASGAGSVPGSPWRAPCGWRTAPSGSCDAAAGWLWSMSTGSSCQWCRDCSTAMSSKLGHFHNIVWCYNAVWIAHRTLRFYRRNQTHVSQWICSLMTWLTPWPTSQWIIYTGIHTLKVQEH